MLVRDKTPRDFSENFPAIWWVLLVLFMSFLQAMTQRFLRNQGIKMSVLVHSPFSVILWVPLDT